MLGYGVVEVADLKIFPLSVLCANHKNNGQLWVVFTNDVTGKTYGRVGVGSAVDVDRVSVLVPLKVDQCSKDTGYSHKGQAWYKMKSKVRPHTTVATDQKGACCDYRLHDVS